MKYVMEEMNIPNEDGRKRLYPRIADLRAMNHEDLVQDISHTTGMGRAAVTGVLSVLAERMAAWMSQGYSVKIDGLGRFTPSLAMRQEHEALESDTEHGHRNAASIEVARVNFKADRHLIHDIDRQADLERSVHHSTIHPRPSALSQDERWALLVDYLQQHGFVTCQEYATLTGLSRTRATEELRALAHAQDSPLQGRGRAPHRMYVLRNGRR